MKVSPINNTQMSNSTNFKGIVDKSVIKYLDNACLNNSNPQNAKIVANRILEKLTNFKLVIYMIYNSPKINLVLILLAIPCIYNHYHV